MTTVALTGATGFIGSHLLKTLKGKLHVKALIRPHKKKFLDDSLAIDWVFGDLEDHKALERLVSRAEVVIHLAWAIRGGSYEDFAKTNVKGFKNLLIWASKAGVKRFLYVSSLAAKNPFLSPYAATKRLAEQLLADAPFEWQVFRPPAVYGPNDPGVTPLIELALSKGIIPVFGSPQNRFSLIYVFDLCEAILCWLKKAPSSRKIYELHDGTPQGYSWLEIREIIGRVTGKAPRLIVIPENILKITGRGVYFASKLIGKSPLFSHYKANELCHPDWICANDEITKDLDWSPRWPLKRVLKEWVRDGTHRDL